MFRTPSFRGLRTVVASYVRIQLFLLNLCAACYFVDVIRFLLYAELWARAIVSIIRHR